MTLVVAVTRPEPQASGTAARLTERGYTALLAPLLEAVPADGPGSADGIGALALTSRTAALILAAHPQFHAIPVFAVGTATAREARRAGFTKVADAAGTVDDLVARLGDAPGPVVHMAGLQHTGDLVERLVASGRDASRRIVYAMAPRPLPPAERVDAVLLFSPRTARVFAEAGTGRALVDRAPRRNVAEGRRRRARPCRHHRRCAHRGRHAGGAALRAARPRAGGVAAR